MSRPSHDQIMQSLRDYASRSVAISKSYTALRFICRIWYEKALAASAISITIKPELVQEVLERMLVLYGFCVEEAMKQGKHQEFLEEDARRYEAYKNKGERQDEGQEKPLDGR